MSDEPTHNANNIPPDMAEIIRRRQISQWMQRSESEREEVIQARLRAAQVPKRFLSTSFTSFNAEALPTLDAQASHTVQTWAHEGQYEGKSGLLLLGPPGNGKTSLAICALRQRLEISKGTLSALHWNVPRGLIAQQVEFGKDDKDRLAPTIIDLCRPDLLILDDLGKHKISDWVQQQFYALLDELWSEEKQVIITSNLPKKAFLDMDQASISRILGLCHLVDVSGRDHRVAAHA